MKYALILGKLTQEPLYMLPEKARQVIALVEARAYGHAASMDRGELVGGPMEPAEPYQLRGTVAVVPVEGIIGKRLSQMETLCGGCDLDTVSAGIVAAMADPDVTAIILDINSPGGIGVGLPEISALIAQVRKTKPVIAFTDYLCASAAYWIAAQCDEFWCTPSAIVGSIGAYIAAKDNSQAWEKAGRERLIFNGDATYKAMGTDGKKWTDAEKAFMRQRSVKATAAIRAAAQANRQLAPAVMQGQVFDGTDAKAHNLVDGLTDSIDEMVYTLSAFSTPSKPVQPKTPALPPAVKSPARMESKPVPSEKPQTSAVSQKLRSGAACHIPTSRILGR